MINGDGDDERAVTVRSSLDAPRGPARDLLRLLIEMYSREARDINPEAFPVTSPGERGIVAVVSVVLVARERERRGLREPGRRKAGRLRD